MLDFRTVSSSSQITQSQTGHVKAKIQTIQKTNKLNKVSSKDINLFITCLYNCLQTHIHIQRYGPLSLKTY